MAIIRDFMFGDNILPERRLEAHRSSLTGLHHRFDVSPPRPASHDAITFRATTSGRTPFELVRLFYTLDNSAPVPGYGDSIDLKIVDVIWDEVDWLYIRHWEGTLPAQRDNTLIRYKIGAKVTGSDRWVFADDQSEAPAQATNFAVWVSDLPAPAWVEDAMVYHVFVDRFNPGQGRPWRKPKSLGGFFGGTIRGIEEKLEYIQSLGYNAIWLSPFFASPSHHGYDATDMYRVEPRLGTNEDLYRLLDAAHSRGMRMILDFVANHWSNLHPTLQAAQKDRQSEFYDWYVWKRWPDEYDGFFGVKSMPKINLTLGSPARQYLLECARFWLEKGFDGYRLDYAYGPPGDFWVDFRRICKQTKPDSWLFGEVINSASSQRAFAGAFDGMIDFLLAEAVRQTFGYGHWDLDEFEAYLDGHEGYFDGLFDRLTILDNHDMNRFLFLAGDDPRRLKLGALLIYTLAGNPINYYGTEAGVTQERPTHYNNRGFFEEARQPMVWGEAANQDLVEYFLHLVHLRKSHPCLKSGSRRTVHLDARAGSYAYLREKDEERLLVLLNLSEQPRELTIKLSGFDGAVDFLNNQRVISDGEQVSILLLPASGAVVGCIA